MKYIATALIFVLALYYYFERMENDLKHINKTLGDTNAAVESIFKKVGADEQERRALRKLRSNLEVWEGTACINCHNTLDMALPIRKISIPEAVKVVRNGTERSRAGGMPLFDGRNTKGKESITDSELQVRFELLYIKELLE